MNEKQFEEALLNVIREFRDKKIDQEVFVQKLKALSGQSEPQQIADFQDEELGWAKTCISEIDYYGIDEVMNNMFNFIDFLNRKEEKSRPAK